MVVEIGFKSLKFDAILGVLEHERQKKQPIEVDLSVWVSLGPGDADDLGRTVDYGVLAEIVEAVTQKKKRFTIEALIRDIAGEIFARDERIERICLSVSKPLALPKAERAFAKVNMERSEVNEALK